MCLFICLETWVGGLAFYTVLLFKIIKDAFWIWGRNGFCETHYGGSGEGLTQPTRWKWSELGKRLLGCTRVPTLTLKACVYSWSLQCIFSVFYPVGVQDVWFWKWRVRWVGILKDRWILWSLNSRGQKWNQERDNNGEKTGW